MISSDEPIANLSSSEWDHWLNTTPGNYVLQWEQNEFNRAVEDSFGFNALQIGLPQLGCLSQNRIVHRWMMLLPSQPKSMKDREDGVQIICHGSIYDLPFENESMDLIAIPHVLEFMDNPHEALREIHRILRPEGRIIISGFNPISLWGLRQYVGRILNQPFLPKEGQFISHFRIKDWLNLLNYSIDRGKFGCYGIPLKNGKLLNGPTILDKAGDRWWPFFGSVFMLSAIKRTPGMRLVGTVKASRPIISGTLAPVSNSSASPTQKSHE